MSAKKVFMFLVPQSVVFCLMMSCTKPVEPIISNNNNETVKGVIGATIFYGLLIIIFKFS